MLRYNRGFTLIELLIVVVIVTTLLSISFYSLQTLSAHWAKIKQRQDTIASEYQALDMLATALHGTIPYEVKGSNDQYGFYFLGRQNGFTGVTESSVYYPGQLAVYRVLREKLPEGGVALFYEEAPLSEQLLLHADQTLPFSVRIKVIGKLEQLSFAYFGWDSLEQRNSEQLTLEGKHPKWHSEFDGMIKLMQPEILEIKIESNDWRIQLSDRVDILRGRRLSGT